MTLTYKRKTELVELSVKAMIDHSMKVFDQVKREGGFLGDTLTTGPQLLNFYWSKTNLADLPLLLDPNTELRYRQGLEPQELQSPYWKDMLGIPGMFKQKSAEFIKLNERYQEQQAQ